MLYWAYDYSSMLWSIAKSQSGQGRPIMSWSTKFEPNPKSCLSANKQKLLDQSEARKWQELSGEWQKVNQAWGDLQWVSSPNLCPNPISGLSANAQKLLNQSEAWILWNFSGAWPKVNPAWGGQYSVMSLPAKFQPDTISCLSANTWKLLDNSVARKLWKFGGAWPKVTQTWKVP